MPTISSTSTIDLNRFRKSYSFIRGTKVLAFLTEGEDLGIETGTVAFTSSSQETYTFSGSYTSAPAVVLTPVDSLSNNEANVNVFASSVSTTAAVIETSEAFSGQVNVQVILIE